MNTRRNGQAWPQVDESPTVEHPLADHDAAVCAVLRHCAGHGLGLVAAWDLTAALGLDLDAAVARATGTAKS